MTVTETTHDRLPEAAADENGTATDPKTDTETGPETSTATDVVDEVLVEEISIDGMCGVY